LVSIFCTNKQILWVIIKEPKLYRWKDVCYMWQLERLANELAPMHDLSVVHHTTKCMQGIKCAWNEVLRGNWNGMEKTNEVLWFHKGKVQSLVPSNNYYK
jgi:hypothetical protein